MASQETGMSSCTSEVQGGDDAHPTLSTDTDPQGPRCSEDPDLKTTSAEREDPKESQVVLCQYFMMGKCRFGHKCRMFHCEPLLHHEEMKKAKVNQMTKPKDQEDKETNKKPRMRTADDVISRILWDASVDSSQFVVGYVDRFLGVLERPFCDFNWETNPCDCDYNIELALPRHRIQYFTYRGHRVWDRHSRTDRVFGSTGQSLAPPFGGEEEVEEQPEGPTPNKDGCPAVGGQEETDTDLCTLNSYTPDSAPQSKGNISQEKQQLQETEDATNRFETLGQMSLSQEEQCKVVEETQMKCEECLENNEKLSTCIAALNKNDNPAIEQNEEKRGWRPPKKYPTHFVTFRANTPAILSCFQQLQEEMTAALPDSAPHWQSVSSLHVTLCLLVLPGPADVDAAADILRRFAQFDRNPPVAVTFPVKLKHFNGRVLYLSPQPQLPLQQLNSGLQEAYRNEGLLHRHSYNPRYHLTLAKIGAPEADKIFEGVENLKVGKGLNFGRLPVNTLHLCSIGGPKIDGFYNILCTATLR